MKESKILFLVMLLAFSIFIIDPTGYLSLLGGILFSVAWGRREIGGYNEKTKR